MATQLSSTSPAPARTLVASALRDLLAAERPVSRQILSELMTAHAGGDDASGAWSMQEAYDALELAQVLLVTGGAASLLAGPPEAVLDRLDRLGARLPTQTYRAERQVDLQQFSTPLPLAYLASLVAGCSRGDLLLEPSAGNGLLACFAARSGARLLLNEIDSRRRASLAEAFPTAALSPHDGELIDDLLPREVRPTLVLMNPPFARSEGRGADRHAAGRHLASALTRLAPSGRLVAIMPESFAVTGSGRALRARCDAAASLRLNVLIKAGAFARHGTGVAVRLIAYDKSSGMETRPLEASVDDFPELLPIIARIPARQAADAPQSRRGGGVLALLRRPMVPSPCQPRVAALPAHRPASEPLRYAVLDKPACGAEQVGLYLPYRPSRIAIEAAAVHPTPLVESLAMGSIAAPAPRYTPHLPPRLVPEGRLSEAQLETLVYAGEAFERDLPGRFAPAAEGCVLEPDEEAGQAYRTGYFLGDGTGAGKGRQIAGIILDQWLRGRTRHIWISKNESLLEDARRDWTALGGQVLDVQPLSDWKLGAPVGLDSGILFVTYPTLRSARGEASRLQQILDWAGDGFDGVIAFDEAHAMANAAGGEGARGRVKGSEQGIAGLRLQNLLARARVVYASATGASDVNNLAYAARLGLWGPQTAFADRNAFVGAIRQGGIAAMELVARDLKSLGLYTARALSFAGVEYDVLEHPLTTEQRDIYDAYADAWAIIHANLAAALEATRIVDAVTGASLNSGAKSAALSRFEGTKQRFFGQLLLSMKLPSLIHAIEADLSDGRAVVVQMVSTAEAMLERRLADLAPEEREALEIDVSPREYVIDYLVAAFPTRQMKVFSDADGNCRSEPLSDDDGRPVHCQAALEARDLLIEQLCALPPIKTALDALIERFGPDGVAEVTGRTRRLVVDASGRQRLERRSARSNLCEAAAFMRGEKRILVFSDAGGTGRSYHACLDARNQARRVHYLLEPGWRADAAIQGLGRTHRTRQASAPLFRPVTTDVRGERRFISTIARRLDALGALTRGQRQTGGQNLFDPADNLESGYAKEALTSWYHLLHAGKLRSTSLDRFQELTGLRLEGEDATLREDLPPIQRWLNRLLAMRIELQNNIFDELMGLVEARVAAARDAGTLDLGVETVAVDSFELLEDRTIRTDPGSGATTHLLRLEIARRHRPMALDQLQALASARCDAVPLINEISGKVALRIQARSLMSEEGLPIARYELVRPLKRDYLKASDMTETSWAPTSFEQLAQAWASECEEAARVLRREIVHLATGLLLPIWDKLPGDHVQVLRIAAADGRSLIGREVPAAQLGELGERFGLALPLALEPEELAATVLRTGKPLPVDGPERVSLRRSLVNGSPRLELVGYSPARLGWYKAQGCFTEIIRYQTRLFVPVDKAGTIIGRLSSSGG